MEITFELEDSDLVVEIDPDFVCSNYSSTTEVQWELQGGTHTTTVANVFDNLQECEHSRIYILPSL